MDNIKLVCFFTDEILDDCGLVSDPTVLDWLQNYGRHCRIAFLIDAHLVGRHVVEYQTTGRRRPDLPTDDDVYEAAEALVENMSAFVGHGNILSMAALGDGQREGPGNWAGDSVFSSGWCYGSFRLDWVLPNPGMIRQAMKLEPWDDDEIAADSVLVVGSTRKHQLAAEAAEVRFLWIDLLPGNTDE